jgi:hypothetical protein
MTMQREKCFRHGVLRKAMKNSVEQTGVGQGCGLRRGWYPVHSDFLNGVVTPNFLIQ